MRPWSEEMVAATLQSNKERLSEAIAGGAIAAVWHSSRYYDLYGGTDHPERNGKVYLIRGSWAEKKEFVCPSQDGYTDEITAPLEETGCQCNYQYFFSLLKLLKFAPEMLTAKGRQAAGITETEHAHARR